MLLFMSAIMGHDYKIFIIILKFVHPFSVLWILLSEKIKLPVSGKKACDKTWYLYQHLDLCHLEEEIVSCLDIDEKKAF